MSFSSRISEFSGNGHRNGNGHLNGNGHVAQEKPESPGTVVPGLSEREPSGRFAAGNKGGPGNPYNRRVAMIKRWLVEVVGEEEIKSIGQKLLEMAIDGDVAAARVLFQYVMPKHVDPDMVDHAEWQGFKKKAVMFAELPGIVNKPAADLPLDIVRAAQPPLTDSLRGMTANLMSTPQAKLDDVLAMLKDDPRAAREYLDMGPGLFFGKQSPAKEGRAKKAKRRKR